MKIVEDVPPVGKGQWKRRPAPQHLEILETLRSKPDVWFRVHETVTPAGADTWAYRARHGLFLGFRDQPVEARVNGNVVYMRYVKAAP